MTTINELIDQTSRAHLPSGNGVAVIMELTLACGDVGDAVGDADDTRADSVADDADDGVAGVLAVAGVPALAVVLAGVCGDVISDKLVLGELLDTGAIALADDTALVIADAVELGLLVDVKDGHVHSTDIKYCG